MDGVEIARLIGHTNTDESLVFSANGNLLLSGGNDGTLRLWNVAKREQVHVFRSHKEWINAVVLSPDDKLAASSSAKEKNVKLWDTEKAEFVRSLKEGDPIQSLAFSPDGRVLTAGGFNHLRFFDVETGELRKKLSLYDYYGCQATGVAFTPDGGGIMSTMVDLPGNIPGRFREWNVKTEKLKKDVALGFSYWPDSPQGALSKDGRLVAFWETMNQQVILKRQCLHDRIPEVDQMENMVSHWEEERNTKMNKVDWQFTTEDARIKLKRLYPKFE